MFSDIQGLWEESRIKFSFHLKFKCTRMRTHTHTSHPPTHLSIEMKHRANGSRTKIFLLEASIITITKQTIIRKSTKGTSVSFVINLFRKFFPYKQFQILVTIVSIICEHGRGAGGVEKNFLATFLSSLKILRC